MTGAYDSESVYKFAVLQECKRWHKHDLLDVQQFASIGQAYKVPFYHPGLPIRIILFLATLLALSGVSGILGLMVSELGETVISVGMILYGIAVLVILEKNFIRNNHHYKSGVTEALLYHSCGFIIGGVGNLFDFNVHVMLVLCLIVFTFASVRYLDWMGALAAGTSFAGLLFYEFYQVGGIFQQIIPFVFIAVFTPLYFVSRTLRKRNELKLWRNGLLIIEALSLVLIYAGGNYLIVRELSITLLNMHLEEGQDIPYAGIFYGLTILLPVIYLVAGIGNKNVVLLRIGMIAMAFSVYTFHHYYSFGPPEMTLTLAGTILLALAILLIRFLRIIRRGFTGENILREKWAGMNVQAFLVAQTMGGNQAATDTRFKGGGGEFGGGGSSGDY